MKTTIQTAAKRMTISLAFCALFAGCLVFVATGCQFAKAALADLANCTGKELATSSPQLTNLVTSGNQTGIESELTGALGQDVACTLGAMASTSTTSNITSSISASGAPSLSVAAGTAISLAVTHGKLRSTPRSASAHTPCTTGCPSSPSAAAPTAGAAPATAPPAAAPPTATTH